MSCVWIGIIDALGLDMSPYELLDHIKDNNIDTKDMLWNNTFFTQQIQEENKTHISNLTYETIKNGYLCSSCDPLFLLIGQLYNVTIMHEYMHINITYKNINANRIINLKSNKHHLWIDKSKNNKNKRKYKRCI